MIHKTNAIRFLDARKIPYETLSYPVDEEQVDALHVAEVSGLDPDTVFKTLVARGDKTGINVFCIPAGFELDLKKAASASSNKSLEMIKVKELFDITGYIRGGCSPLAMKKHFPTFLDETAQLHEKISISGGIRGLQILIDSTILAEVCPAKFYDLIR